MAKPILAFSQEIDELNHLSNGTATSHSLSGSGLLISAPNGDPVVTAFEGTASGSKDVYDLEHSSKPSVQRRFVIGYDATENDQLYVGTIDIDGYLTNPVGTDIGRYQLDSTNGVIIKIANDKLEVYPTVTA